MAERLPDLAREHRLHDRFRGPPRASPVRFQVSRPADRTSRGWARGVPLAECRFPGPATRRLGRLRRESERSTQNGRAKTLWWWWWQQLRITSGRLPRIWGSICGSAMIKLLFPLALLAARASNPLADCGQPKDGAGGAERRRAAASSSAGCATCSTRASPWPSAAPAASCGS